MTSNSTGVKRDGLKFPDWQWPLIEALEERENPDREKLKALVMAAETAIFDRQQVISNNGDHRAEQQAIGEAVELLRILKTEVLKFPDWKR